MTKDQLRRWLKAAEQERDNLRSDVDWAATFSQALASWPEPPAQKPPCENCHDERYLRTTNYHAVTPRFIACPVCNSGAAQTVRP